MSESSRSLSLPTKPGAQFALVALLSGAVAIGFAPILVRLSHVGPIATAFWRMGLAVPFLWLLMGLGARGTSTPRQASSFRDYWRLILAGLFLAADIGIWHMSLSYTSVANATLLANCAPLFVTLGGWLLFRQRVSRGFLVAMLLALAGAVLLVGSSFKVSLRHLQGDMMGVVTAFFYAGYILSMKRLREEFSAATVMTWTSAVTALTLLPLTLLMGETLFAPDLAGWTILFALALFAHVGGQGMIAFALAHLPASFSSVGLLVQPVVAALLAWGLFDETLEGWQALGGALVLVGILIARRESRPG